MNIDFSYFKKRGQFGKPCFFLNEGPILVENLAPAKTRPKNYVTKVRTDKATQEMNIISCNEVNTRRAEYADRGINHDQGGWPKDLNIGDDDAVLRFRKKLERDETYIESMKHLSKPIEHAIMQNNAIDIYQKYFEGSFGEYTVSETLSRIRSIYRDPTDIKRAVSHLSWSPEKEYFAAAYCNLKYQHMSVYESTEAYIWHLEIPNMVHTTFNSKIPIMNLEWNPMDKNFLIGGLFTGQIAFYDVRKAPDYVEITDEYVSHRDPVHSVLWINSKTGVDFFSTSTDGVVKWWDCRNLSQILDMMILDVTKNQKMDQAYPATFLSYDHAIPSKYLVGCDNGYVICGNRRGSSIAEKLSWVTKCHSGPVKAVARNPAFNKFYLTVGSWNARIWSEECKESAIMWTKPYRNALTCGEWSTTRYSVFYLARSDGYLDLWDMLLEQRQAFVTLRVSDIPLTTIRGAEQGNWVLVGDSAGKCALVQYAESLTTCLKNDRTVLNAMFDRESHRERLMESRMKEIRLALKLKALAEEESTSSKDKLREPEEASINNNVLNAELAYWKDVTDSISIPTEPEVWSRRATVIPDESIDVEEEEEPLVEDEEEDTISISPQVQFQRRTTIMSEHQ